jgi:hypothetical protein
VLDSIATWDARTFIALANVRASGVVHFLWSNVSVADEFHRRGYVVNIELRDLRRPCDAARRAAVFIARRLVPKFFKLVVQQSVKGCLKIAIDLQDKTLLRVVSPILRISAKAPLHVILSLSTV